MCQAQLEELLERMSASQADENAVEKRAFVRWPLDNLNAQLELEENGRYRSKLTLAARNVSNSGISLLHSSFFYPGTPCRVTLPRRDVPKLSAVIEGHIMWCVHIEGLVHELGVKFDTPVDSSLFVTKMMASRRGNAAVSNSSLSGRVLHVDDSAVDRKLIEHFLAPTKIELSFAETIAKAKQMIVEPYDLILCDLMMPDGNGVDLIQWMRDQCITTPVAIHSSTPAHQVQSRMQDLAVQGFLSKPIDRATLLTAMTEFLSLPKKQSEQEANAVLDTTDPGILTIVKLFKVELGEIVAVVQSQIESNDTMPIYATALRLQGMAPTLGFAQLGKIAGRTAESLAATMSCEESKNQLDVFVESCRASAAS